MSLSEPWGIGVPAIDATFEARLAFIRRAYLHLAGAIVGFVLLSIVFYQLRVGAAILRAIAGNPYGWLLVLGAFALVGWLGSAMAQGERSMPVQYAGLGIYTVAEAIIFAPLILIAAVVDANILPTAAGMTLIAFAGLSVYVLTTRKDFSFLRTAMVVGSLVAVALIIGGAVFGFSLGIWFSAAMILLACAAILYSTSRVLHQYRTDQYVAAALELFAAVALLFWYVIRLLLQLQRR